MNPSGHETAAPFYASRLLAGLRLPAARLDPYPVLEQMSAHGPVLAGDDKVVLITGYHACAEVLRSTEWGVIDAAWSDAVIPNWRDHRSRIALMNTALGTNGAEHQRHRKCMIPALSRRSLEKHNAALRELTATELRNFRDGFPDSDFAPTADRITVLATCRVLGMVPHDFDTLRDLVADIAACHEISPAPAVLQRADEAVDALRSYLRAAEAVPGGLLSELREAEAHHGDDLGFAIPLVLLIAGWETTSFLLLNLLLLLHRHPGQEALLRRERALIPNAVEEALRFEPPTLLDTRVAVRDTVVEGHAIPARRLAYVFHAAANRDPAAFVEPNRFDVRRDTAGHLAFGHGSHLCVGAQLARVEAALLLTEFFDLFPDGLEVTGLEHRPGLGFRGFRSLRLARR
ncbi:cytochrome P450 [Streptomyces achromogenes]|uniref:cytochrome P450 n=1 Tax=Streptomyces achromogenes TaxID=67255 RepID=UPI0036F885A0